MTSESNRFTSDRRPRESASWVSEDDWEAGTAENVDVVGEGLVARGSIQAGELPNGGSYDFSTFDTEVWTVYNDARYVSSSGYVTIAAGGDKNGELVFNSGVDVNNWFCEWDNIFESGNYERQRLLFYADAVGQGGDNNKLGGVGQAYLLDIDYNGRIWFGEIRNEGVHEELVSRGEYATSEATHTYRIEYRDGLVDFFVDGTLKFEVDIPDPTTDFSEFYFKAITGRNSSTNHIDNVTIGSL